jgi:hypothetical protein
MVATNVYDARLEVAEAAQRDRATIASEIATACGVRVEELPWATGKHHLTKAYVLFLAHRARKLSC